MVGRLKIRRNVRYDEYLLCEKLSFLLSVVSEFRFISKKVKIVYSQVENLLSKKSKNDIMSTRAMSKLPIYSASNPLSAILMSLDILMESKLETETNSIGVSRIPVSIFEAGLLL